MLRKAKPRKQEYEKVEFPTDSQQEAQALPPMPQPQQYQQHVQPPQQETDDTDLTIQELLTVIEGNLSRTWVFVQELKKHL